MSTYEERVKHRAEIADVANSIASETVGHQGMDQIVVRAILHLAEVIDVRFEQILDTQERVAVYDYSRRQGEREE